ncbi:MAG: hypothetical protein RBT45_06740 [Acholeplasmataceae bacterium]|jgi:hypothetical protein|nr:hypothetical protein [Acholeplasmataceae bacterium]
MIGVKMTFYRQDRLTKQIFRRSGNGPEEFNPRNKTWEITPDAFAAFHDSSDTIRITELQALDYIEKHEKHHV